MLTWLLIFTILFLSATQFSRCGLIHTSVMVLFPRWAYFRDKYKIAITQNLYPREKFYAYRSRSCYMRTSYNLVHDTDFIYFFSQMSLHLDACSLQHRTSFLLVVTFQTRICAISCSWVSCSDIPWNRSVDPASSKYRIASIATSFCTWHLPRGQN